SNSAGAGGSAMEFPASALAQYAFQGTYPTSGLPTPSCSFGQNNDGALDSSVDTVRFALMTSDPDTAANTGVANTTTSTSIYDSQFAPTVAGSPPGAFAGI